MPSVLQRLAAAVRTWPHFLPPASRGSLTAHDVALADSVEDHIRIVREWAGKVWASWSEYHAGVARLVTHLEES